MSLAPPAAVGFIGLGNMGRPLATNLVQAGFTLIAFDQAGEDRVPEGARAATGIAQVAADADVVVLSLPDGAATREVAAAIAGATVRPRFVIDTSTVGVDACTAIASRLAQDNIVYLDAPVSGGVAGAQNRSIAVMFAGPADAYAEVEPVLAGMSDNVIRVGDRAGLGQVVKLANNFLSATALAAASEAVAFAEAMGVDMAVLLNAVNHASGRSQATADKFVNHVLTGLFSSGFSNMLMHKDVGLYVDAVDARHLPRSMSAVTSAYWREFALAEPGVDFTRIYPFVKGSVASAEPT